MKILLTLALCFLLFTSAKANEILKKDFKVTLNFLEDKPKSYAKDFFIIQFLKDKTTSQEDALTALSMANSNNGRVKQAFNKRFLQIPNDELRCYKIKAKNLIKENEKCIAFGLTIYEATTLKKNQIKQAIKKLDNYPTLKKDLEILSSSKPFYSLIKAKEHRFFRVFFKVGKSYRQKNFNRYISKEKLQKLSSNKNFEKFISYAINDDKLYKIQKSLISLKKLNKLNHNSSFSLGINAIVHKKEKQAIKFLKHSYKKAYYKMDKDKSLFWLYKITNNENYLKELSDSWDNNIYSAYAKEKKNIKFNNIIYTLPFKNTVSSYDTTNQFEWVKVIRDIRKDFDENKLLKYENLFSYENTIAHKAYILERYHNYKKSYYLTPFKKHLENKSKDEKILIYSIARQESRFIPSSISTATAQGVMQIMPFLSKDIAKRLKEPYNIYEQFIVEKNLKYGAYHLNTLKKQFNNNILFIAYAYNGGAGYLKKQLKRGLFKNKNKYEPFLSMERISYKETRKYGKKVLFNYMVYNNYLKKENKKITSILQTL